jgi:hypothetical protein
MTSDELFEEYRRKSAEVAARAQADMDERIAKTNRLLNRFIVACVTVAAICFAAAFAISRIFR